MASSATDPRRAAAPPSLGHPGAAGEHAAVRGLARRWWLFLLRGAVAIAFGVIALANPALGLIGLLAFVAARMLLDGVLTIAQATVVPAVDTGEPPPRPANDPGRHGRGAA